jgi:hypothetical protein
VLSTPIWRAAAWGEKDACPLYRQGAFLRRVVALSPRASHSFLSQDVADAALGDGDLELVFKEISQFLLSDGWVLSFLLPQPGPTLRSYLVWVSVAVINKRLPGRASLPIATAELGKVVSTEGKARFLAKGLKVLPLVETLEELFLGQSSLDLTDGIALHGIPPEAGIAPWYPRSSD